MNAITQTLQGGASPAALLARSNPMIRTRHHWFVDLAAKRRNAAEAKFREDELAGADEENAKIVTLNGEEANRLVPGTIPDDQMAVNRDVFKRKQQLRLGTRTAHAEANAAKQDTDEQVLAQDRLIASMKTLPEIPFAGWPDFKRPAGKSLGVFCEEIGAQIVAKLSRKADVKSAPRPADEFKRWADQHIAIKAEEGALHFTGLDGDDVRGPGFEFPMVRLHAEPDRFQPDHQPRVIDFEALACRFYGDQIRAEVHALIDEAYLGVDDALGPDERRKLIRELDREIAELERLEAAVFWAAVDAGEQPKLRPGMSAKALLGIR